MNFRTHSRTHNALHFKTFLYINSYYFKCMQIRNLVITLRLKDWTSFRHLYQDVFFFLLFHRKIDHIIYIYYYSIMRSRVDPEIRTSYSRMRASRRLLRICFGSHTYDGTTACWRAAAAAASGSLTEIAYVKWTPIVINQRSVW